MNQFGGDWTKAKIEILVEYAQAYLTIMNKHPYFKLYYFDGFAGSGFIIDDKKVDIEKTVGAARRIIEISEPKSFDVYYFVEKDPKIFALLKENTANAFPQKKIHATCSDCNEKLIALSDFLRKPENKKARTLAYIDPYGMQVEWSSLERLKGLQIDMWILVPTGLGVNRLLKNNGNISDAWLTRLEKFLGLGRKEIEEFFYKKTNTQTLFEEITIIHKLEDTISKSAELYKGRLEKLFTHVSQPYELSNKHNSVMYHLFLATNNDAGFKIANGIVKKYTK